VAEWEPFWQALTPYAESAVVVPTSLGEWAWHCTANGISGAVEPSWPVDPSVTPTVADGSVVWTVGTAFRQDLQRGLTGLVSQFALANPTIIRSVLPCRPKSFTNAALPCFYVGDLNETIVTGNSLRTRTMAGFDAYLVDLVGDQIWVNRRMQFAADALVDLFTRNFHAISGRSILEQVGLIETEFNENGTIFEALQFQFGRTFVTEGRI
jgi:hypothetical protein